MGSGKRGRVGQRDQYCQAREAQPRKGFRVSEGLVGDEAGGPTGKGCEFGLWKLGFLQVQLRRGGGGGVTKGVESAQ